MQIRRPSDRELVNALNKAQECLKNRYGLFANPTKVRSELDALDIDDTNDIWKLISELLKEILPKDYKGTRPPQKSYEKAVADCELMAFSWWSFKLGKQMYIKFVLKNAQYYYISLHQCRSIEQEGED